MQTWCPHCREPLPVSARECACGASFIGPGAWQPLDVHGHPVPQGRRRADPKPFREWRLRWQPPTPLAPHWYRAIAWLSVLACAASCAWLLYFLQSGAWRTASDADEDASWLMPLAFGLFARDLFKRARKSRAALAYGAMEVTVRRENNMPLVLACAVRHARPLKPRQRERAWTAQLEVGAYNDKHHFEALADETVVITHHADGKQGSFRYRVILPNPLPDVALRVRLTIRRDANQLFGMPLELPVEVVLEIDQPLPLPRVSA